MRTNFVPICMLSAPFKLLISRFQHVLDEIREVFVFSNKFHIHRHYNNEFYARVGGVSNADLNKMELELLFLLDFRVTVSFRVFESYCFHLEKEMQLNDAVSSLKDIQPMQESLSRASTLSSLYV